MNSPARVETSSAFSRLDTPSPRAQTKDFVSVGSFVRDIGFPIALILLCCYAVWQVGKFLAPIIQRMTAAHIDLVQTLKENDTRKTDVMEAQAAILLKNTEWLGEIHKAVVKQ